MQIAQEHQSLVYLDSGIQSDFSGSSTNGNDTTQ